jgi:glycine cleavage system H protein
VLESTKAAADVYAPISGTIVEVNETLSEKPELINQSPEANGWLFKIKPANPIELDHLLDEDAYRAKFQDHTP